MLEETDLREFLSALAQRTGTPEAAVAIAVGGETRLAAQSATGDAAYADPSFELGCLSELFIALLILRFAEEARVDLNAAVSDYLPELRRPGGAEGGRVQVRHLLSHCAGYRGLAMPEQYRECCSSWEAFVEFFQATPQLFTPGTVFNNERSEYLILAQLIARLAGREALDVLREAVLNPLRVLAAERATHRQEHAILERLLPRAGGTASSLWTATGTQEAIRLSELVCFARAFSSAGSGGGAATAMVSPFVRQSMLGQDIALPEAFLNGVVEHLPVEFGLGCARYHDGSFGRSGTAQGECSTVRFFPQHDIAVAVGVRRVASPLRDFIVRRIFEALIPGYRARADLPPAKAPPPSELALFAGSYQGGSMAGCVSVSHEDGALTCRFGAHDSYVVVTVDEQSPAKVTGPLAQLPLAFFRDPKSGAPCLRTGLHAFKKVAD